MQLNYNYRSITSVILVWLVLKIDIKNNFLSNTNFKERRYSLNLVFKSSISIKLLDPKCNIPDCTNKHVEIMYSRPLVAVGCILNARETKLMVIELF